MLAVALNPCWQAGLELAGLGGGSEVPERDGVVEGGGEGVGGGGEDPADGGLRLGPAHVRQGGLELLRRGRPDRLLEDAPHHLSKESLLQTQVYKKASKLMRTL